MVARHFRDHERDARIVAMYRDGMTLRGGKPRKA